MTQPQPQLLSMLQKAANPIDNLDVKIKINGVFAPPEQWKITDQANPNIFTYSIKILGQEFIGGKIQPRKLTEKQLKQLEQKGKKASKKQAKQQQKPVQTNPAQEERKKKQWQALSEQQKFYKTQQDPYKSFSLKFSDNEKTIQMVKQNIQKFQQSINSNNFQVQLVRKPEISEDQLQKLKKSKPKNLNIGQLYPAVYKIMIDTKQLKKPGTTNITQRSKAVFSGNAPDDCIKIQTDSCYVFIELDFSQPLNPEVKEIKPTTEQITPKYQKQSKNQNQMAKLKQQICKSIRAISQEYVSCFSKEKEHTDEKRHNNLNSISTLRLNQINKRKQIFLNEFFSSGKFAMLKQRISKYLKAVVIDKFRKQKQIGAFSIQQINQVLSQLNLYFQQQFTKIIDQFMGSDSTSIHEDLVLGYQQSRQVRKNALAPVSNQTQIQRQLRLASQYQILEKASNLNQELKAEKHYINFVVLSNYSKQAKESYAKFCLRSNKFNEAYAIYSQISSSTKQLKYQINQAIFLVDRRRIQQATKLVNIILQSPDCSNANKINLNLLLSFMHQRENDVKNSQKYLATAERYFKIKNNPHLKVNPTQNPYDLPKPRVPKPERYISQLSGSQSQQIRNGFVFMLSQLNLYNLVSEYLPKLQESSKKSVLQIHVDIYNRNYQEALKKIQLFLSKGDNIRNIDYLMIKADICYKSQRIFQCQQIFLNILELKPDASKIIHIYLRLGFIYISRKSWKDAKHVFQKACQNKYNCSVAWLGLGISNLNLGKYSQAQEALNLSKIYNPLSKQTQQHQVQIDEYQRNKHQSQTISSKN